MGVEATNKHEERHDIDQCGIEATCSQEQEQGDHYQAFACHDEDEHGFAPELVGQRRPYEIAQSR